MTCQASKSIVHNHDLNLCLYSFSLNLGSLQPKNNTVAAQEKCIIRLVLYHLGVNLPVMVFSYPVFRYMGMQSSLPLPSWYLQVLYCLWDVIWCILSFSKKCKMVMTWLRHSYPPSYVIIECSLILILQDSSDVSDYFLLCPWGFYILLGTPNFAYKVAVQACSQCSSWVSEMW